jgi:hypothetical protein
VLAAAGEYAFQCPVVHKLRQKKKITREMSSSNCHLNTSAFPEYLVHWVKTSGAIQRKLPGNDSIIFYKFLFVIIVAQNGFHLNIHLRALRELSNSNCLHITKENFVTHVGVCQEGSVLKYTFSIILSTF